MLKITDSYVMITNTFRKEANFKMKKNKLTDKQIMERELNKARTLYSEGKYAEACEKFKRLYKSYNEEKYCYLKYEYTR